MFRKLQWKLTLLHTVILVAVLAATNLTVYFLLQAYNVAQIANEADAMLGSLEASAWVTGDETEVVPQTIDVTTPAPDGEDAENGEAEPRETRSPDTATPKPDRDNTENEVEAPAKTGTAEGSSPAPESDDPPRSDDPPQSDEPPNRDDPPQSDEPPNRDDPPKSDDPPKHDDSSDDADDAALNGVGEVQEELAWLPVSLSGSGLGNASRTRVMQGKATLSATRLVASSVNQAVSSAVSATSSATPATSSVPTATPAPEDARSTGDVRTLHVPAILKQFTFYLVFDLEGNLTEHNVGGLRTLNRLMALAPDIREQARPEVRDLPDGPISRVLLMRRSIEIDGVRYGSYLVGRDLSLVTGTMENLGRILLFGFLAGVLVSLLIGYLLAGRAIRPIREAYEAKQRFLADASHELRTPISVVLLSAESLERSLLPGQAEARNDLDDIRAETFRMRDLVERLLFLARSDSRMRAVGTERVALSTLLEETAEALAVLAKSRRITLEQRLPPELACRGDRKMLASLFTVLLENAIKYNRDAGRVIVEGAQLRQKKRTWVEIRVSDTGVGIPEAEQARIFERFYRADPARGRKIGGHGLGLAIARDIAQAHGGTIGVISQAEIGTTFIVRLPAAGDGAVRPAG